MFKKNQHLITPVDFDNAMYFGIPVLICDVSEVVDEGGVIEKHTDNCVFINGGYYIKSNFQFKVRNV